MVEQSQKHTRGSEVGHKVRTGSCQDRPLQHFLTKNELVD